MNIRNFTSLKSAAVLFAPKKEEQPKPKVTVYQALLPGELHDYLKAEGLLDCKEHACGVSGWNVRIEYKPGSCDKYDGYAEHVKLTLTQTREGEAGQETLDFEFYKKWLVSRYRPVNGKETTHEIERTIWNHFEVNKQVEKIISDLKEILPEMPKVSL